MDEKWQSPEASPEQSAQETETEITQNPEGDETAPEKTEKPSWEDILQDPEYRRCYDTAVQSIVQHRLRNRQNAEQTLEKLAPVLEALRERYGGGESLDAQALAESIRGDGTRQREEIRGHLDALLEEAALLRESLPDFDLLRELEDPAFLRLTAPHSGVSLADAYYARHRGLIGEQAARQSLEAFSRSMNRQASRPRENHGGQSAARLGTDPRGMSRQEREALKKRILEAGARGRKLPVGE